MIIREYEEKDRGIILELFNQFGDYFVGIDDMGITRRNEGYAEFMFGKMQDDVKNKEGKVFIAEDGNNVIGFIAGVITYNKNEVENKDMKKGRVIELFVTANNRSGGVGRQLMHKLEEYFKNQDCEYVNVEVFGPNKGAFNFYQRNGYYIRNIDLIKKL